MYLKRKIDCLLPYKGGRGLLLGDPDALGTHHSYRQDLGPLPPPTQHPPTSPLTPVLEFLNNLWGLGTE
jgi:hypothetical protein